MDTPYPAYTGGEPYIFVSYSHNDSGSVYDEITWLNDAGFNVWYDEGIAAGTEWREELAKSIEESRLVLFFVTPGSVESQNCRKEINYAIDLDIPIVAIYLEDTTLPGGLKLSLSDRQAILKFQLTEQDYRQKLESRISVYLEIQDTSAVPHQTTIHVEPAPESSSNFLFEIKGLRRLEPPRRSLKRVLVWNLIALLLSGVVGGAIGFKDRSIERSYFIYDEDLIEIEEIILALHKQETTELNSLWSGLDRPTRELITSISRLPLTQKVISEHRQEIRSSFNSLISSNIFILGSDGFDQWSEAVQLLSSEFQLSKEKASVNRFVLDLLFESQLRRWLAPPTINQIFRSFEPTNILIFVMLFIVVWIWSSYFLALESLQISFKNTENVEEVLDYLVQEMGFKPPIEEKNSLVFRATISTVLLYTILKLRVNISGNQVLITAPLPIQCSLRRRT
jgi:hypothetical protein